jgi:hydroxyacylglutathione hydrolase
LNTLRVTAAPAFTDNYIWLIHSPRDSRKVIAVDPGDADAVKQVLQRDALELGGILITHHHGDHTGGLVELSGEFNVRVFAPARELIPGNTIKVSEGDAVSFDDLALNFTVLDVPGHTAGHIAYIHHDNLFSGDTLFSAGCGRLFEGTPAQMFKSLQRLAQLPINTQVYCTHEYTVGNLMFAATVEPDNLAIAAHLQQCHAWREKGRSTLPTSIGVELNINPFLRVHHENVKRSAEHYVGQRLNSDVEVFAALREWKNHFKTV